MSHSIEDLPLYSKKLHILVLLANTSCVTSLTIFPVTSLLSQHLVWSLAPFEGRRSSPLFLELIVVNHFANLTFPCREMSRTNEIPVCLKVGDQAHQPSWDVAGGNRQDAAYRCLAPVTL